MIQSQSMPQGSGASAAKQLKQQKATQEEKEEAVTCIQAAMRGKGARAKYAERKETERKAKEGEPALFPDLNKFNFVGMKAYTLWPADAIRRSIQRVRDLKKSDNLINRMDWFAVFNDCESPVAGSYLQLPSEEFDRYDVSSTHLISANAVIMAMAMLSPKVSREDGAKICFQCYDCDGGGTLDVEEVTKMVRDGLATLQILGVMEATTDESAIQTFIHSMMDMGDSNSTDQGIPESTYVSAYINAQDGSSDGWRNAAHHAGSSHSNDLLAIHELNLTGIRERQELAKQKYNADRFDAKEKKAVDNVVLAKAKKSDGLVVAKQERALKKIRARTCKVASNKAMTVLLGATKFEYEDLLRLRKQFTTAANTQNKTTGRLEVTKARLVELLLVTFPDLGNIKNQLERLTGAFDIDGSGCVDFDEFVTRLNDYSSGTFEQKCKLQFQILDKNDSGAIDFSEFEAYCIENLDDMHMQHQYLQAMVDSMALKSDGLIQEKDLVDTIAKEQALRVFVYEFLGCMAPSVVAAMTEMAKSCSSYGVDEMVALAAALSELTQGDSYDKNSDWNHTDEERLWAACVGCFKPTEGGSGAAREAFHSVFEHYGGHQYTATETAPGIVDAKYAAKMSDGEVVRGKQANAYLMWGNLAVHAAGGAGGNMSDEAMNKLILALFKWKSHTEGDSTCVQLSAVKYAMDFAKQRSDDFNTSPVAAKHMFKDMDSDGSLTIGWEEFFEMCQANVSIMTLGMGTGQ